MSLSKAVFVLFDITDDEFLVEGLLDQSFQIVGGLS
jgi:hypothetical protein